MRARAQLLRVAATLVLATAVVRGGQLCDIYGATGSPCVAAFSMTRALYAAFNGALYQVNRSSDGAVFDVRTLAAGGYANAPSQDAFCAGTSCVVQRLYDQSPQGNDLAVAPAGGAVRHGDKPVNATRLKTTAGGVPVYGAFFESGNGYRNVNAKGVATGNEEQTIVAVMSAQHVNEGCCYDFGLGETSSTDKGPGTMEAIYLGNSTEWGHGAGAGPWVMADLEDGLWAGSTRVNNGNSPVTFEFLTAMVRGGANGFGLKSGDATMGSLTTQYDGPRPNGYQPMRKQNSIILGIGGDNSDWAVGSFFEGVLTAGLSTDAADDAVQADIVAAAYGQ